MWIFAQAATQVADPWWMKLATNMPGAVITATVALIVWWLNRKRPSIIQVEEISQMSLVRIAKSIHPRITVQLDDKRVAWLSQIEFEICNISSETIRNISAMFEFPAETKILDCEIIGAGASRKIETDHKLVILIEYLNSHAFHRERSLQRCFVMVLRRDTALWGVVMDGL